MTYGGNSGAPLSFLIVTINDWGPGTVYSVTQSPSPKLLLSLITHGC